MGQSKNLSIVLPIELHCKFSEQREKLVYTNNSEYMAEILTEYYDYKENGGKSMADQNTRTLAIQISAELMERIKAHLKSTGLSQKAFLTGLYMFSVPRGEGNAGNIDSRFYMDSLQLEESEYNLIKFPQRGVCLFKCGIERYYLAVHAPKYKAELFGTAGGR